MNTQLWDSKPIDPVMNGRNCQALDGMYGAFPLAVIRAALPGVFSLDDYTGFRPLDSVCPPTAWFYLNGKIAIFIGGTSGTIHLNQLINGWANVYEDWVANRGASGAFANAARQLITEITPEVLGACSSIYIFGHSYGGAVAQALAVLLYGQTQPRIRVWSYGSPRAGLFRLGTILTSVENTRFFADNDPVRFIPPHSTEVPALTALDSLDLVRGCNRQVQAPTGYELQADGKIVETEGNATVLHAVALSIASWCMDASGFRSVNHALSNYIQRFGLAAASLYPNVDTSAGTVREREEVLTIRQRERVIDQGEADIANALAMPQNFNEQFAPLPIPVNSPLRYLRRRVGRQWGVKFNGQVVAIGPGKRAALKLARAYNKAAQSQW